MHGPGARIVHFVRAGSGAGPPPLPDCSVSAPGSSWSSYRHRPGRTIGRAAAPLLAAAVAACSRSAGDPVEAVPPGPAAFPDWRAEPVGAGATHLRDAWFRRDGSEGWAVGTGGVILHLAGDRWHPDTLSSGAPPIGFGGVAMSDDARMGFAVGSGGWMARYEGGHRWSAARVANPTDSLAAVWLDPAGVEGYAVGAPGVVLRWSEGRWTPLALPGLPPAAVLVGVGANRGQLWIQDQPRLHVFSRPTFARIRDIPDFEASRLWVQSAGDTIWAGGVAPGSSGIPVSEQGYMVRRYVGGEIGSMTGIPVLPGAGWFGTGGRCGIVAGDDGPHHRLVFISPAGSFAWPIAASINAVWTDGECRTGWVVGENGFVARLGTRDLTVKGLREGFGASIEHLTGAHSVMLDSGVPLPEVDSLQLLHHPEPLGLYPASHFSVDTVRAGELRLTFTPEGRARAKRLAGNGVRLRFFLRYPVSDSTWYPVAYDRSEQFVLMPRDGWRSITNWIIGLVLLALAVLLARFRARGSRRGPAQPPAPPLSADPPVDVPSPPTAPVAGSGPTAFLCHSHKDKPRVRELYRELAARGIKPWLDEENLLGGQDWERVIRQVIRDSTVVVICLSRTALARRGVFHQEIRIALDEAQKQPPGAIYIIPTLLSPCDVPDELDHLHVVDLADHDGVDQLAAAIRAASQPRA